MSNVIGRAVEALEEIVEGKGPFSTDPLTHAANCIEAMQEQARAALAELRRYEVVEGKTDRDGDFVGPDFDWYDEGPAILLVKKEEAK
jgi:hypothetical protein